MKTRHAFLCLMAFVGLASMTDVVQAQTKREVPQKVETPIKVTQNAEWYKTQERLWKAEIDKNPKNEEAWANYYKAVRYRSWCESMPDINEQLDAIVEKMGMAIPRDIGHSAEDSFTLLADTSITIGRSLAAGDVNFALLVK